MIRMFRIALVNCMVKVQKAKNCHIAKDEFNKSDIGCNSAKGVPG